MKKLLSVFVFIAIAITASLFVISCEDLNNDPDSSWPLLSTMSSYSEDGTLEEFESYRYDTKGRLIEMVNSDARKAVLEYSPSMVTLKEYEEDELEYEATFNLNSQSLCISSLSPEEDLTTYTYDDNGYRSKTVEEDGNTTFTETYTVSNQNYVTIIKESNFISSASLKRKQPVNLQGSFFINSIQKRRMGQNTLKSASDRVESIKTDFQFYTDNNNTIDMENMGISFFGKQNKNPVKKEIETYGNWPAYTTTYTYEYDSKGRISKKVYEDGNYDIYTYVE